MKPHRKSVLALAFVFSALNAGARKARLPVMVVMGFVAAAPSAPSPTPLPPLVDLRVVDRQFCALDESGSIWCWGDQPPDAPSLDLFPRKISSTTKMARLATTSRPCGLDESGGLWCGSVRAPLTRVGTATWRSVTRAGNGVCGVRMDGTLWCGIKLEESTRVGDSAHWSHLEATSSSAVALTGDGAAFTIVFKEKSPGKLEWLLEKVPAAVLVKQHVLGPKVTCQLGQDGRVRCVGNKPDFADAAEWKTISLTSFSTPTGCGITREGRLMCWGHDYSEIPGVMFGGPTPRFIDEKTDWTHVAASFNSNCALRADGSAWCWGDNENGQLGNGRAGSLWASVEPGRVGELGRAEVPLVPSDLTECPECFRVLLGRCVPALRACEGESRRFQDTASIAFDLAPDDKGVTRARQVTSEIGIRNREIECLARAVPSCGWGRDQAGYLTLSIQSGKIQVGGAALQPVPKAEENPTRPFDQPTLEPGPAPDDSRADCSVLPAPHFYDDEHLQPFIPPGAELCVETAQAEGGVRHHYALRLPDAKQWRGSWGYLNNKPHGRWRIWDEKGRVLLDETYVNGVPDGPHGQWDRVGGRILDCTYKNGSPVGVCRRWAGVPREGDDPPKQVGMVLMDETWTDAGTPVGTHRQWDEEGRILREVTYDPVPEKTTGRSRKPYWAPITLRVAATKNGQIVHYRFEEKGALEKVVVHNERQQVTAWSYSCATAEKLVRSALSNISIQCERPHFAGHPHDRHVREGLDFSSQYDVKCDRRKNGEAISTVMGRPGTNVAGDVWEVHAFPGYKNPAQPIAGKNWENPRPGLFLRHSTRKCVDPIKFHKVPPPLPPGPEVVVASVVSVVTEPSLDGVKPGDPIKARVNRWKLTRYRNCEPLSEEEVDGNSPKVPTSAREGVQWKWQGMQSTGAAFSTKVPESWDGDPTPPIATPPSSAEVPPACRESPWWPMAVPK